jgi:hypothetical protein
MYSFFDYLPHAQNGMQQDYIPRLEDFPDYNSYRAAMDEYTAMNGYNEYPEQYDSTSQQVRWHPEWNDEEITPQQAQMVAQSQNVQAQQPVTPTSAPIPTRPSYTGPSIVDYLGMNGKASDFNSRKILAKSLGIDNYKGTASQNTKLLKQLLDNPNGIGGYNFTVNPGNTGSNIITGGTGNNGGGNNGGGGIPNPNPIIDSTGDPIPTPMPIPLTDSTMSVDHKNSGVVTPKTTKSTDTTSGTAKLLAIVGATVAAGGITAFEAAKFRNLIKSGAFKNSAQLEEQLANARYGLRDKTMTGIVNSAKEFQEWWKGLPKKQKSILNNLDANEIAGFNSELRAGTALKDVEAFNAVKEAEAEAQALKDLKMLEGTANEAKGTGQMLREAYLAAKSTPWVMKTLNLAKKLRFEDGGSTFSGNAWYQDGGDYDTNTMNASGAYGYQMGGYIPDYQMAYGGSSDYAEDDYSMMAKGGEMIRRADGSYSRRGLWDNIRANKGSGKKPTKQMLAQEKKINARSMKNGGTNNAGFEALPEYVQAKILSNMGYGGYYNPMMGSGGEKMPPEIARARFAAAGNLDQMDNYGYTYGGATPQNYYGNQGKNYTFANGGRVGQEMEVTPQEAEMLRQQGYQFEILK